MKNLKFVALISLTVVAMTALLAGCCGGEANVDVPNVEAVEEKSQPADVAEEKAKPEEAPTVAAEPKAADENPADQANEEEAEEKSASIKATASATSDPGRTPTKADLKEAIKKKQLNGKAATRKLLNSPIRTKKLLLKKKK